jgi:hypothetical protein
MIKFKELYKNKRDIYSHSIPGGHSRQVKAIPNGEATLEHEK